MDRRANVSPRDRNRVLKSSIDTLGNGCLSAYFALSIVTFEAGSKLWRMGLGNIGREVEEA
jgi:hypothetical protein